MSGFRFPVLFTCACAALCVAACEREEVRVYTVAKDARDAAPEPPPDEKTTARPRPQITYTVPAGWEETPPASMSLANFHIKTDAGEAVVNLVPLAEMAGRDAEIVNLWRQQVGEPPLPDIEAMKALTSVEVAGEPGKLFEITGTREGDAMRLVTAFVHRRDASWFYKLQGPDAVVTAQKPAFLEFLKSVRIKEAADVSQFAWTVPPGWKPAPAGTMQVAKFTVPARDEARAEVSVSIFPTDTGGVLSNVNRWRKQLGLGEIDEAGLKDCTTALESLPDAVLADLTNNHRQLLGAIVPRGGKWWFYKLMGDAPAVVAEREAFIKFAASQP